MTFLPVGSHDADALSAARDEAAPLIGERAVALFEHALCAGFGGSLAEPTRAALVARGEDPDHPQVTEAEQLLIDWGRAIGRDRESVPTELQDRLAAVFSPASRTILAEFAGRVLAANVAASDGA